MHRDRLKGQSFQRQVWEGWGQPRLAKAGCRKSENECWRVARVWWGGKRMKKVGGAGTRVLFQKGLLCSQLRDRGVVGTEHASSSPRADSHRRGEKPDHMYVSNMLVDLPGLELACCRYHQYPECAHNIESVQLGATPGVARGIFHAEAGLFIAFFGAR